MAWWLGYYQLQSCWMIVMTDNAIQTVSLLPKYPLFFLFLGSLDIPIMYHIRLLSPPIYRLNYYAVLASFINFPYMYFEFFIPLP